MTEISTVVSLENNQALLSCTAATCESCAGNSFCNIKAHTYSALIPHDLDLKPGDRVEVYLPPGRTIFSGFMVLIFPLLLFLAGFLITGRLVDNAGEGIRALGGFAGLAAGFAIGYLFGRVRKRQYMPSIRRLVPSE